MPQNFIQTRAAFFASAMRKRFADDSVSSFIMAALIIGLVVGMFVYINYLFWRYTQWTVAAGADTASYWIFQPHRTVGYPVFIRFVFHLTGDLNWLGVIQLNLLLLSYAVLSYGFARLTNRVCGVILFCLWLCIMPLIQHSQIIATESIFAAMICLHMAAVCFYLRQQTALMAFFVGLSAVGVYFIRPNGLPFMASLVFLALVLPRSRRQILITGGLPILAGLVLAASAHKIVHDSFATQMATGHTLLQHVLPLLNEGDGKGSRYEKLLETFEKQSRADRRKITAADWPREYWRGSRTAATHPLLFGYFRDDILRHVGVEKNYRMRYAQVDSAMLDIALIIVKKHPWRYLRHATAHYYGLWHGGFWNDYGDLPAFAKRRYDETKNKFDSFYAGFIGAERFRDEAATRYGALAGASTLPGRWWGFVSERRPALNAAVYIFSLASFVLLLTKHRRKTIVQFAAYTAFLLHACTLLIAAVHPGLERYTVPLIPVIVLFTVSVAAGVARVIARAPSLDDFTDGA